MFTVTHNTKRLSPATELLGDIMVLVSYFPLFSLQVADMVLHAVSSVSFVVVRNARYHAVCVVQLPATARWNQCVYCSVSAVLPLHHADGAAAAIASPERT